MASARRPRRTQRHAVGEAARASVFPDPAAFQHGSRDRLAAFHGPAIPGAQPAARAAPPRFAVPGPGRPARRSPGRRHDAGSIPIRALAQNDCGAGPADTGRATALLVEELRHLETGGRWSRLAAAVDAADSVLGQAMAAARPRSGGRCRHILPAPAFLALAGHTPPGARLAFANAPHRGNGPHPGGASSRLCAVQRHLSRRHAALCSAAHRRRPRDSTRSHVGADSHGSVVVRNARRAECVDAWRLQPSAGPMGQRRPAGCVWHTATLHWRNAPLVGVSRCLR